MDFHVVIPTRNRPALLEQALGSVLAQQDVGLEVVVVVDGAVEPDLAAYRALADAHAAAPVRWLWLPPRAQGHGPSFVRNTGVEAGGGDYVAFLDDDDLWLDPRHLRSIALSVQQHGAIDLLLSAQRAVHADGSPHPGPLWLDAVAGDLGAAIDEHGNREASAEQLLRGDGFSHLNVTVFRRDFFLSLGGLDELLRYEEDRDLFLRGIDAATRILYRPAVTALHRIPAPRGAAQASRAGLMLDRRLQQLRVLDKCLLGARRAGLRRWARRQKVYLLAQLADLLREAGRPAEARGLQLQSLALRLT